MLNNNSTISVIFQPVDGASSTIAALPNLSGAGNVHGLQLAMARDTSGKLTDLVQAFIAAAGSMTLAQARSATEAIQLDWMPTTTTLSCIGLCFASSREGAACN